MNKFTLIAISMLLISYVSINPLWSSLFMILSLISISPIMVLVVSSWMWFVFLLLFLTGVLSLVVYFTSLSTYLYYSVDSSSLVFAGALLLTPYVFNTLNMYLYSALFSVNHLLLASLLIFFILSLILFCGIMISFSGALRAI